MRTQGGSEREEEFAFNALYRGARTPAERERERERERKADR
jgi:hypothetical protein